MYNWLNIIQNKLLPPRCILCGDQGFDDLDLCRDCFADLSKNVDCCYRCAESFAVTFNSPQLCGRCLKSPPHFDDTHAPFLYQGSMSYLVSQLKFNQQYKNARLLGTILARHLQISTELPECIIPMPLHHNRYRERGFNQSIEISRHLSRQLNIPMDLHCCIRHRDTAHQASLSATERLTNISKAFSVVKPLNYQYVAIVDDVMTTGATASALAGVLKQNGVSRVDIWVCSRA